MSREGYDPRSAPSEKSSGDLNSAKKYALGIHKESDQRKSVHEVKMKIAEIFKNLPEETKRKIGNKAVGILQADPTQAIDMVRSMVEDDREQIAQLDNPISVDQIISELDKLKDELGGESTVH